MHGYGRNQATTPVLLLPLSCSRPQSGRTGEWVAPPDKNGADVSMMSLNAIQSLKPEAASLAEVLKRLPLKDPAAPERANSYVARPVALLTGTNSASVPAANERRNGKRR